MDKHRNRDGVKLSEQTAGDAPQMSFFKCFEYQTTLMVLTHLLFAPLNHPLIRQFHRVAVPRVSCRNIQSTATRRFRRDKQSVDATKMIDYHLGKASNDVIHRLLAA